MQYYSIRGIRITLNEEKCQESGVRLFVDLLIQRLTVIVSGTDENNCALLKC
jgi:hypothetical protein